MAKILKFTVEQQENKRLSKINELIKLINSEIKSDSPNVQALLTNLLNEINAIPILQTSFNRYKLLEFGSLDDSDVVDVGSLTTPQRVQYIAAIKDFLVYTKISLL